MGEKIGKGVFSLGRTKTDELPTLELVRGPRRRRCLTVESLDVLESCTSVHDLHPVHTTILPTGVKVTVLTRCPLWTRTPFLVGSSLVIYVLVTGVLLYSEDGHGHYSGRVGTHTNPVWTGGAVGPFLPQPRDSRTVLLY